VKCFSEVLSRLWYRVGGFHLVEVALVSVKCVQVGCYRVGQFDLVVVVALSWRR
jgi:hypothetical protein